MSSKKAISFQILFYLIIFSVILIIVLGYQAGIFSLFDEDKDTYSCVTSIKAGSFLTEAGLTNVPLKCRTGDVFITKDLSKEKWQRDAKYKVAEAMKGCWGKFQRGAKPLFEGEDIYCNICSVIQFSENNKDNEIQQFSTFLRKTPIPKMDIMYMDYLMNFESAQAQEYIEQENVFNVKQYEKSMSGSDTYAVIFLYAKGEKMYDEIKRSFGDRTVGAGVIGGTAAGVGVGAVLYVLGTPVTLPLTAVALVITGVGAVISIGLDQFYEDHPEAWFSATLLTKYDEKKLASAGCRVLR